MLWTEISDRNSIRIKRSRTKSIEMPRIRQRTEISTETRSVNKNPSQGIWVTGRWLIKLLPNFLSLWMSRFLFRPWQEFLKRYWLGSPSSFWWILKRMSVFRPLNWSSTHVSIRFLLFPGTDAAWITQTWKTYTAKNPCNHGIVWIFGLLQTACGKVANLLQLLIMHVHEAFNL